MAVYYGKAKSVIWGIQEMKPITNIPPGAKIKIRMRNTTFATAFVKLNGTCEQWIIVPTGGKLDSPTWELGWVLGSNKSK